MPARIGCLLVALAALLLTSAPASAHEKWFADPGNHPLRWDLFLQPMPLAFFTGVLVVTGLAAILWYRRRFVDFIPGPEAFGTNDERRRIIYGLLPLIIGIHFAIALLSDATQTELFSPNVKLHDVAGYILSLAETFCALAFFYGGFTRLAAIVLALCWLAGVAVAGPETMLENAHVLGAAAFFYMSGRGPIAVDRLMFPRLEPPAWLMRHAVLALRLGLGVSLTTVAFTEKFANLPLVEDFLKVYPLNFTGHLGLAMPDPVFALFAASVELLVGLWILFGIFPREIIILAWLPFNLTLSVFNSVELVGHLPIYGIMALLLIWIPGNEKNLDEWVDGVQGSVFSHRS